MIRTNRFLHPRLQQRMLLIGGMLFLVGVELAAQRSGNGAALTAIGDIETTLNTWIQPVSNICYILGAIIGIIGGFQVYSKYNSGDPQAGSSATKWAVGAGFFLLVPTILTTLFGVNVS